MAFFGVGESCCVSVRAYDLPLNMLLLYKNPIYIEILEI